MKKLFAFMLTLILILSAFAACTQDRPVTPDVTSDPGKPAHDAGQAVKITREPTEEPTAAPTEVPLLAAERFEGNFKALELDVPILVDLDGDGADDRVYIKKGGYSDHYHTVSIELASKPGEPFVKRIDECYEFIAAVVDFEPDDDRIEVVFCYDEASGDYDTFVFRVNKDGTAVDTFEEGMEFGTYYYEGFPRDFSFDPKEGFPCMKRTEILGTFYVEGRFTVTDEGIKDVTSMYAYPDLHGEYVAGRLTLERELTLTLLDEDFSEQGEITLPAGSVIFQRWTDRESWVIVELEDGRLAKAEVRIVDTVDEWGVYINGIRQDELALIPYAD